MGAIVAQFAGNGSFGSRMIEWFDHGAYSHVDIVLPSGELLGARNDVIDGIPAGVQIRPPNYVSGDNVLRVDLPAPAAVVERFYELAHAQIGKPYDRTAIVGFVVGRDWREDDSWFCSELFMWLLEQSGYLHRLSAPCEKIAPDDALLVVSAFVSV